MKKLTLLFLLAFIALPTTAVLTNEQKKIVTEFVENLPTDVFKHPHDVLELALRNGMLVLDAKAAPTTQDTKEQIAAILRKLPSLGFLVSLKLENLNLETIPEEVFGLSQLETLSLKDNKIKEVSYKINQLTHLKKLDLQNNKIKRLSAGMGALKNLETLNLQNNELSYLPMAFSELRNINQINLSGNNILDGDITAKNANRLWGWSSLKVQFGDKIVLDEIEVIEERIVSQEIPVPSHGGSASASTSTTRVGENVSGVTASSSSSSSSTSALPAAPTVARQEDGALTHDDLLKIAHFLVYLKPYAAVFNQTKQSGIEGLMRSLVQQRELSLSPINSFMEYFTDYPTKRGEEPQWDQKNNSKLIDEISKLTFLKSLSLRDFTFEVFPSAVTRLSKLEYLNITRASMRYIYDDTDLGAFKELLRLDLSENMIGTLPPTIGDLPEMHKLLLSENRLASFPPEIAKLKKSLTELDATKMNKYKPEKAWHNNYEYKDLLENDYDQRLGSKSMERIFGNDVFKHDGNTDQKLKERAERQRADEAHKVWKEQQAEKTKKQAEIDAHNAPLIREFNTQLSEVRRIRQDYESRIAQAKKEKNENESKAFTSIRINSLYDQYKKEAREASRRIDQLSRERDERIAPLEREMKQLQDRMKR